MNAGAECSHAVRPNCIQVVDEWESLANVMKRKDTEGEADKKEDGKDQDRQEEEQVDVNAEQDDNSDDEDLDKGKREVRKFADPMLPTDREVKEHYVSGHMPFRG